MNDFDLLAHLSTILIHLNLLIQITDKPELKEIQKLIIKLIKED